MREPRPLLSLVTFLAIAAIVAGCASPYESTPTPQSPSVNGTNATQNSTTSTPTNVTLPTGFNTTSMQQDGQSLGP
jgi:PBP1b-binding outer membrane lipoprotein LpoB